MVFTLFDIESDGLLDTISLIHCLSYKKVENGVVIEEGTLTSYEAIVDFIGKQEYLVGHNVMRYDKPALELILGIKINCKFIDTLAISYYLYPYLKVHGLEAWGERVGVQKPYIEDWSNQSLEDYIHRCESDVEINFLIFEGFFNVLFDLYDDNLEDILSFLDYITYKMDCLREQEEVKISLNVEKCNLAIEKLLPEYEAKVEILSKMMPRELGKLLKTKPKSLFKKDNTLSVEGRKWIQLIRQTGIPTDSKEYREAPNPGSDTQLKAWLTMLGWKPITFGMSKATKKEIPKVSLPFGQGICPSVKMLFEDNPGLEELEGLFKVKHRLGVFKSYLKHKDENNRVVASAAGFTNTLRLTHSAPVVNLPKPGVYYGKEVREVLEIPDDSYIMCGSDVSGLEDNTKQHYIYPYDPTYVEEMRVPGFDAHIDIGKLTGSISEEEELLFRKIEAMTDEEKESLTDEENASYKTIKKKRGTAKSGNFAMTYNAFPPKVAEVCKITLKEAEVVYDTYWTRNWAIKEVAESAEVKTVDRRKWLRNPISGFWLYLKDEKDRFSTLNQNSGVFVFDCWVRKVRQYLNPLGIQICLQYHDEILLYFKKEHKDEVAAILRKAMKEVNEMLALNVEISISVDFGVNYAECH